MNISRQFIERPVMTLLLMAALVIFGIFGYVTLPVSELPNIDFPTISVNAVLPGADPETMAAAVATPLENAFATIPGLDTMTSSSTQGRTRLTLQFRLDRNIDAAGQDVEAAIAGSARRLPKAMPNPPNYSKVDPSALPIFFISLFSKSLPIYKVDQYARSVLAPQISTLDGVAQVNIRGGAKYAVRIQADPNALAARQMGINDLANAANATNTDQATGTLNGASKTAVIHAEGQLTNADAFRRQIIGFRNGAPVTFGDVSNVVDSLDDTRRADWLNDQLAITDAVQRQPGSNTIAVVDNIRKLLPQFQAQLPASIQMEVFYDRSQTIRAAVNDVQITLLIAGALVVGVIFIFLRRVSATFIPAVALPIAVIGTFAGMSFLGFNLDNLSLMALTLSVGFVVDDAIVMLENIVRHVEAGEKPFEAALKGSGEIGFTILSMTISLAAVFIPLVFMGGIIGRLLHEFAVTIIVAILISGFVSVTLTPMLCARILESERGKRHNAFYRASESAFNLLHRAYDRSLRWCLAHRPIIFAVFLASILGTYGLFQIMQQDFLPSDDFGELHGSIQMAVGTSFDQSIIYVKQVAAIIGKDPNVSGVQSDEEGELDIALKPLSERKLSADQVAVELRAKLRDIPGTRVTIINQPILRVGARGARSNYQYTLKGLDLKELEDTASRLLRALQDDPTFVGVNSDHDEASTSVQVDIDRNRAASLGITPDQIETALGAAFGGQQVSQIYTSVDQYQVVLELLPQYQQDASALSRLYLTGAGGAMVPLTAVTKIRRGTMSLTINHSGQIPSITISFDLAPGKALSDAVTGMTKAIGEIGLPANVQGSFAGTAAAFQSSNSNMGLLLLIAMLTVYIILGILYESFVHPLTILSGLPSAAVGALATLYVFGIPLTVYAFVGMMMLVGIVKKNAIMMIDFALQRQRKDNNVPAEQAIYEAAMIRFRPIMMTTMSAMMGTLPIALGTGMGAESRRPLGLCVAGGLLLSQLLTLFITPVLYTYLDRFGRRFDFGARRRALAAPAE
ncbi:MAG TPA: efflux RND transporter permease subunit [Micropepsaceae bacterium]|nr:efflux RND transporter permease subunit [Micropepsaceae bacterium]